MEHLDASLKGKPDVAAVAPVISNPQKTVAIINVVPKTSPQDTKTAALIATIRDRVHPGGHRNVAHADLRRWHHRHLC